MNMPIIGITELQVSVFGQQTPQMIKKVVCEMALPNEETIPVIISDFLINPIDTSGYKNILPMLPQSTEIDFIIGVKSLPVVLKSIQKLKQNLQRVDTVFGPTFLGSFSA